jgi:osmotically-inducible protein OsmY
MSVSTKLRSHLIAAVGGAAAAYYLDPDRGRARRARSRDVLLAAGRDLTRDVEKRARYYEGKVEGVQARVTGRGKVEPADDHLIKQGIQQQLASAGADTTDVVIDVTDGVVGLRGQADSADEIKQIELVAMAVPGVDEVQSWLHLPGQTAPNKAVAVHARTAE